jgi:hypothetical protein
MSQMIPLNQIEGGDVFAMLIDDTSVFNLQILQAGLGLSEESAKKWCSRHRVKAVSQGRTWLFTGATFRKALEAHAEESDATG